MCFTSYWVGCLCFASDLFVKISHLANEVNIFHLCCSLTFLFIPMRLTLKELSSSFSYDSGWKSSASPWRPAHHSPHLIGGLGRAFLCREEVLALQVEPLGWRWQILSGFLNNHTETLQGPRFHCYCPILTQDMFHNSHMFPPRTASPRHTALMDQSSYHLQPLWPQHAPWSPTKAAKPSSPPRLSSLPSAHGHPLRCRFSQCQDLGPPPRPFSLCPHQGNLLRVVLAVSSWTVISLRVGSTSLWHRVHS